MYKFVCFVIIGICGSCSAQYRIINGLAAQENQFPYMVSLQKLSEVHRETRGHICGAAAVNLKQAITAASCTLEQNAEGEFVARNPAEYRVFAGSVVLTNDQSQERIRSISNFTRQNLYNPSVPFVNDIAIINFEAPFSSAVLVPVLLSAGNDPDHTNIEPCQFSGWGAQNRETNASTELRFTAKTVSHQSACTFALAQDIAVYPTMICASASARLAYTCMGDIGGPLVCNGRLTGVLIRGTNCTISPNPEVYTRISSYIYWLNSNLYSNYASTPQLGTTMIIIVAIVQALSVKIFN